MQTIDTFAPGKAFAMGILFSGVNPKNLILTLAAASAIAQTGIDAREQAVALAVFVVIGTLGPGLPVAMYFALGARARHVLDELKAWMAGHNAAIMAVLCLVIGAKLIGDGISGLSRRRAVVRSSTTSPVSPETAARGCPRGPRRRQDPGRRRRSASRAGALLFGPCASSHPRLRPAPRTRRR
jgi:hypothetical protein